jgi:hypothetical protein
MGRTKPGGSRTCFSLSGSIEIREHEMKISQMQIIIMKSFLVLLLIPSILFGQTKSNTEEVLRRVADNIIKSTSFPLPITRLVKN